jgi:transcriptional regulator with XRE-family HTH domain
MANSVQSLCERQGLSVPELAAQSGLDVERTLAIYEGRWTPSPTEREKLATALGVMIDDIAWGHGTPVQHLWGS